MKETGLTCSAGVSFNKFLAKIASNERKPDGIFTINPEQAREFLKNLPVRKIPGVGNVTQGKLRKFGIDVVEDLLERDHEWLEQHFGKFGRVLHLRARGLDDRPVEPHRQSKSISVETTFDRNLMGFDELAPELEILIEKLLKRCRRHGLFGKTLTLKLKFSNFHQVTRSESREQPYDNDLLKRIGMLRLKRCCIEEFPRRQLRMLGIGLSNFPKAPSKVIQLDFFEEYQVPLN